MKIRCLLFILTTISSLPAEETSWPIESAILGELDSKPAQIQNSSILIIGEGGREHALAWKARQSLSVDKVFVAPGNGGTSSEPGIVNVNIKATDIDALVDFASNHSIGLTIVGPETALAAGIVDAFSKQGMRCFGRIFSCSSTRGV